VPAVAKFGFPPTWKMDSRRLALDLPQGWHHTFPRGRKGLPLSASEIPRRR
jgi:hypothetical protein